LSNKGSEDINDGHINRGVNYYEIGCNNQEIKRLGDAFGIEKVIGQTCDVTDFTEVQSLWDTAKKTFGIVDIWINNAGITNPTRLLWEVDEREISPVINTNITGVIYGSQVALKGMLEQGSGQIYNMEGFGSGDMMRAGMTIYGTTKRATRYFTESLVEEAKETPVLIGALGPGMVVTDFMLDDLKKLPKEKYEETKTIYNILADTVEIVTPFLVEKILANDKTGVKIDWLTTEKANSRFEDEEYLNRNLLGEFGL
jgi:NADP-dependent 3-hydroxy acid dehydrogenase YdfG